MQDTSALGRALAMVRDLRARCPWDRVQTRETLRPYLVEEVLEVDQALAAGDPQRIRDEMGDFLLHLAWQLVLGEEEGEFTAADVADTMERKMKRRHPHLFELGPPEPWERLKRRERSHGVLGELPASLPDLLMAYRLQERAAAVGFDWPDTQGPIAKVREELAEVERELAVHGPGTHGVASDALTDEIGDLLFAAVNLARKAGVQPGPALDRANRKFRERFEAIERLAAARGIDVSTAGLETLDRLWDEAKAASAER
ncbi:MAG TPA: nucleoside triphosphate pyrophosphohydrolase [Gemmatimonadales bacterium]|nr:nucleoside triphosphate pyrophosphohydrolase [Gemmatimonadales bacterium]